MLNELFQSPALWFTVPALLGTGIFLLKLLLIMVGLDHHGDADGLDGGHGHHGGDASGAFKLVSVQTTFGFIMGFGWGGLVCLKAFEWSPALSVLGGLVSGSAFGFLVALLLHAVKKMESSGNVNMASAVGHEADVYANIPAKGEGRGQVRVVIGNRERIVQATSDGPALKTGSRVKVVHTHTDNSIIVTPV
ncbi:MAG: hypothetical protein Q8L55_00760 [Phycisphaerales bacterium]|nr:hypothetical protein [Phycisphaerales bacterium]